MGKLLLKLSVAVIALSVAGSTAEADSFWFKKKTKSPEIYGTQFKKKRKSIFPWWKSGIQDDIIFDEPEKIPGKGMGNLTYFWPKNVPIADPSFAKLSAADDQSRAILAELFVSDSEILAPQAERQLILDHYKANGFKPLWLKDGAPSERAQALLDFAGKSYEDGLDAPSYLPQGLSNFDDAAGQLGRDREKLAQFDIAMTAAALKLALHISGGQFEPNRLSLYNDIKTEPVDAAKALRVLALSPYPAEYLRDLAPKHPAYAIMKAELAKLRASEETVIYEKIPEGKPVKIGGLDPRMPMVRQRMVALGFLSAQEANVEAAFALELDLTLSDALKKYQASVQISPTGTFGPKTLKSLNSVEDQNRTQQLVYNMERLRWLPKNMGDRHVFVNQADFNVHVMDKGKEIWKSNVIVGKTLNQTSAFHDEIETVVFNPSWGVPQSIIVNEYLPKLYADPGYLDQQGFRVSDRDGNVIPSSEIDWFAYGGRPPFDVQQPPGRGNALGELKFLFPNSHDIYMHDTPTKNLFSETSRAFSHGCVRVQNPREFATILLGWDREEIDRKTDSRVSQSIPLPRKVPVHITYFTAWPDSTGKITYYNDIYKRDEAMEKALAALASARAANLVQKLVQN